jgi:hypothetical protein
MASESKAARIPRCRIRWGCVSVGLLGLTPGLAAIGIELARNWQYGMTSGGTVVAATYALFAVGLAVIPGIAARRGWNVGLACLMAGCMAMTGFFGLSYYAGGILEKANAARTATLQYRDAREAMADARRAIEDARIDAGRAQAAADAIAENTPSAELQRLADAAMARRNTEGSAERGGCGRICKAAEQDAADYLRRKGDASAKEAALARVVAAQARMSEAQARLDAEKVKADRGAVDASPLATLAAAQLGGDAQAIAAHIDTFEPIAMVALMLLFASLVHPSLLILLDGFRGHGGEKPEAAKTETPAAKATARRGRKPMTVEERILQFAAEKLRAGIGEITGGELYEAFAEWWRIVCPGVTMPSMVTVAKLLTEQANIAKRRKARGVVYGAQLVS